MTLPTTDIAARAQEGSQASRSVLAYEAIREAIAIGDIRPGEWLRQEPLAEGLNVSQVPVREALVRLVAEGLAVHVPYKGVRAVLLAPAELRDVYEARALLEGFALELAAERITPAALNEMRDLLPKTVPGEAARSPEEVWKASREFHLIAVRASGRRHLIRLVEQILDLTNPYSILRERTRQKRRGSAVEKPEDHTRILKSLEAGDGERARKLVTHHLDSVLNHLLDLLAE